MALNSSEFLGAIEHILREVGVWYYLIMREKFFHPKIVDQVLIAIQETRE